MKKTLKEGLQKRGELLTITQVAAFCGIDRHTAAAILRGTPCLRIGSKKLFTAEDIAEALIERREAR